MNLTRQLLAQIRRDNADQGRNAGPLLKLQDSEGNDLFTRPYGQEAVCLRFVTDSGKVAFLEGARLWNRKQYLENDQVEALWKGRLAEHPHLMGEDWAEVSWVLLKKS